MNWTKKVEERHHPYTAPTVFETDGYRVWKGRRNIVSCIYSGDYWHLERRTDHRVVYSARTAKACMEKLERDRAWCDKW